MMPLIRNYIKKAYYYNKSVKKLKKFIKRIYFYIFQVMFILKRKEFKTKKIEKILFISLFFKGDTLYNTPLFQILKTLYPDSKLDVWVKSRSEDILKNNPFVNELIVFDDIKTAEYNEVTKYNLKGKIKLLKKIRNKKYDLIIDFTGLYSTALFVLFSKSVNSFGRNLQGFGFCYTRFDDTNTFITQGHLIDKYFKILKNGLVISDSEWNQVLNQVEKKPQVYISEKEKEMIDFAFKERKYNLEKRKLITIHIGAGWEAKKWSIEKFKILINNIFNKGEFEIAIVGDKIDKIIFDNIKNDITLSGKTDVKVEDLFFSFNFLATAEIIRNSSLFIGSDSGPLHLAFALNIPSISLFGPTNPEFSKPIGDIHKIIYKKLNCSALENEQYCSRNAGKSCPDIKCMDLISVNEILGTINLILGK